MPRRRPGDALRAGQSGFVGAAYRVGTALAPLRCRVTGACLRLRVRIGVAVTSTLLAFSALILAPVSASAQGALAVDPVTQTLANDIITTFTAWVAGGATWILGQVVGLVQQNTAVDLNGGWFQQHYATMIAIGAMVMVPMLLAAAVKAAFAADPGIAIKAAFVYLPLAFFGTFVAINLVNMLLAIVDWASAVMSTTLNADYQSFAKNISTSLTGGNAGAASVAAPFVIFICAVFMVIFGLLVFVELLFRNAAIYATAVFIPLAMATLVFPSTGKIAKRLIETLLGLILLKFFIVAVFSIGVSALGSQSSGGSFGTVLGGIVVLILAAVLPNLLIGLLPLVEGAAVATIAARTTTTQIIQPTSNQIYTGIRRQNELRASGTGAASGSSGFTATTLARGVAGGAATVALAGVASRGSAVASAAGGTSATAVPVGAGPGGIAVVGGSVGGLGGGGATAVGSVFSGSSGGSPGSAQQSGAVAAAPAAVALGTVTGLSTRRIGGKAKGNSGKVAGPPSSGS